MLRLLRITNFALIDHLELEFTGGLNLFTGETGSGKSIIIDALGLALGERASAEMIRTGAESTQVEALFSVPGDGEFMETINSYGISIDENELIIRRDVALQGKSRIFINNSLATLQTLRALGAELVDVQGQGEHHALQGLGSHRRFLDQSGGNSELVHKTADLYSQLRELQEKRQKMQMSEQDRLRRQDLLRFQIQEIDGIAPRPGEDGELQETRVRLANAGKLSELANRCYDLVYERQGGLLDQASQAAELMARLQDIDARSKPYFDQISNLRYTLEDTAYFLRDYLQSLEFEPDRLESVETRLAHLENLKRKYGGSLEEVLHYLEEARQELQSLESHEEYDAELKQQFRARHGEYLELAARLSQKRRADARELEEYVTRELRQLAMEKIRFRVVLETAVPSPENDDTEGLTRHGLDGVEFYVALNPGEELKSLAKTASGGELSRIHLALKNAVAADWSARTMVFDEVDAGIGGRVAELVGKKLKQVSRRNQVICVTHLPQIAAFADRHFHIYKQTRSDRTQTHFEVLDGERRIQEIARMLGGSKITETTTRHAREMLQNQP